MNPPVTAPCPWLTALKTAEQAVSDLREAMRQDGYIPEPWLDTTVVNLLVLLNEKSPFQKL